MYMACLGPAVAWGMPGRRERSFFFQDTSPIEVPGHSQHMKRTLDLLASLLALLILCVPMLLLALMVAITSKGPILYWSDRVGQHNRIFRMPKLRTMKVGTPAMATHLLANPLAQLTPVGGFLRRTSLDELPQLWSIFTGDMSLVGPRPALFNQSDLIEMRTQAGVHLLVPGLTGWAQVNGRDEIALSDKVQLDTEYLQRQSFGFDLHILWLTVRKVVRREGITH
jgi:O-antigen biosynthesis protein WbqP